jgi:hypothetical protein
MNERSRFVVGERVYWRRRDLFGSVEEAEVDGHVLVKLEWPWDPNAPAERAPAAALLRWFEME